MITKSIPSLFTVGNLFLGIMAILFAVQGEPKYAAILVIIAMLLDGLDGRMARMLNASSEFGKELDSLSDIVSFGVAPAIIMYGVIMQDYGLLGIVVTSIFPICGALRLARFSVQEGAPGFFIGLPITAAGGVLATFSLYYNIFHPILLMAGMLLISILMVSNVKYPNFKKVGVPRAAFWLTPILIGVIALLAYRFPSEFSMIVFIPLALYAVYGIKKGIESSIKRKSRKKG